MGSVGPVGPVGPVLVGPVGPVALSEVGEARKSKCLLVDRSWVVTALRTTGEETGHYGRNF